MTSSFGSMPITPFSTEADSIDFATADSWSATELSTAMQALDGVYTRFLLARHLAVLANDRNRWLAEEFERYRRQLEQRGPHIEMFLYEWQRLWRELGPAALPSGLSVGNEATQISEIELDYYLSHSDEYMPASHELMIQQVVMASPGGFSLRGLGEPLRELRELIKDLCYRNRQERERGDLDIVRQRIALLTQTNLPPKPVQILAISVSEDAQELKRLIEDGKLMLPGEAPPKLEKPKTTRRRRPRRKPGEGSR